MQDTIIWVNGTTLERIVTMDGTVVCTQRVRISDKERCEAVMTKFWRQLMKEQGQGMPDVKRRR